MKNLELGRDYINGNGLIVVDRLGDYGNRGFDGNNFEYDLFCSSLYVWREATKEAVIEAFKKHLPHRFGDDWKTMKIKEKHPDSGRDINNGLWEVEIVKMYDGWNVWNTNGLLYCNGIWVERLEEEPKIHIKEAIKENAVIHCETEQEAKRILGMAHELGYKWANGEDYTCNDKWYVYEDQTYYYLFKGRYANDVYVDDPNFKIINSTDITDMKKSTDYTPEDIKEIDEKAIEKRPIDKVTTKNLDIALRMVGIQLDVNIIDKVIDLVELIEHKGDDVTIKDIVSLQQTW